MPPLSKASFAFAFLFVVAVSVLGSAAPARASGATFTTDLNGDGSTSIADFAIFGCAFLGGDKCPDCPYVNCNPGPPDPDCEPSCPLVLPPCDCGSGVPTYLSDFTCDGRVGLADIAIFAIQYLQGTNGVIKCD